MAGNARLRVQGNPCTTKASFTNAWPEETWMIGSDETALLRAGNGNFFPGREGGARFVTRKKIGEFGVALDREMNRPQ